MFLDYAEEMITSLFEAYRASPKTLKMSIDDLKGNTSIFTSTVN